MDLLFSPVATAGIFVILQTNIPISWLRSVVALPLVVGIFLLVAVLRASWGLRQVVANSDKPVTVLGKPLLFPVTLTHTRRKPVSNQFSHRVLLVGTPVGLRGRLGTLLSIDDKALLGNWISPWTSWFGIDSSRYLHRGDEHLGLREKLHRFLRTENIDPAKWPYAYVLSVPQWLWWSRNVVAWWYLFSPDRKLDAVIMEINNSFDEKRNVLFQVHEIAGGRAESEMPPLPETVGEDLDVEGMVHSLPSVPVHHYQGSWEKHVYASPFEKVEGSIATRFLDPLQEDSWSSSASLSNTTSISPDGQAKLSTRISCCERPVDPTQASAWTLASLLLRWTLPITLTTPRILFQALRIEYLGLMRMLDKPGIQRGSVPRRATSIERTLEPFFREYLARHVQTSSDPIEVSYLPSQALSIEADTLRSPGCATVDTESIRHLEVEPLEPGFFVRIAQYDSILEGLNMEMQPTGDVADSKARPLWVSDPQLLRKLLSTVPAQKVRVASSDGVLWQMLVWLRGNTVPTAMDVFVQSSMSSSLRVLYLSSLVQDMLAQRLAGGSNELLQLYRWCGVQAVRWLLLHVIFNDGQLSAARLAVYLSALHVVGRLTNQIVFRD